MTTTIEMIQAEIGRIPPRRLGELYLLIKRFAETEPGKSGGGVLSKLQEIQIDGPADFSSNLDLYLSGEKSVGDDVH